jgi:hypothetical protein
MKNLILILIFVFLGSCSELKNRTRIKLVNWTLVTTNDKLTFSDVPQEILLSEFSINHNYDSTTWIGIAFNFDIEFYSDNSSKEEPIYQPKGIDGSVQVLNEIRYGTLVTQSNNEFEFLKMYANYKYDSKMFSGRIIFKSFNEYILEFNRNPQLSNANNEEKNEVQVVWIGNSQLFSNPKEFIENELVFMFANDNVESKFVTLSKLLGG